MVNGMLFPLKYKPTYNGEDYYTCKGYCALNVLFFVNHMSKVHNLMTGCPGSVHDTRV